MRTDMQLRDNMSRSTAERKQAERDRKFREACDAIEETEVGAALKEIRDRKLYRDDFKRFEDYCQERWGFAQNYANRHIASVDVVDGLVPIGTVLPANEAQCRPLTKLADGDYASRLELFWTGCQNARSKASGHQDSKTNQENQNPGFRAHGSA